jgi:site-specific DNA-methyltransferase (adenine-specific)
MTYKIHQGDNRQILKTLPDNSIDAIVTDPPYGIDFLGKSWDADTGALETYQECLRVLKPGGHILAFSAARTYHHLAITLEQAGFEIRDQIMWIYSSGFPKSQDIGKSIDRSAGKTDPNYGTTNNNGTAGGINLSFTEDHIGGSRRCNKCKKDVAAQYDCKEDECGLKYNAQTAKGKQWQGWGTQLKPAHEPICLARKPLKQSIAKNCQEWGVGALNIDATRVGEPISYTSKCAFSNNSSLETENETVSDFEEDVTVAGRFPSNVLGEITEEYQKYFYCPKVSRQERHIGFEDPGAMFPGSRFDVYMPTAGKTNPETTIEAVEEKLKDKGNNHPTVKPVELMKYLIKLITPPGGTVLDPFNGSGTTGMAATELGFDYIGCELDPKYVEISEKRIEAWRNRGCDADVFDDLFTFGD